MLRSVLASLVLAACLVFLTQSVSTEQVAPAPVRTIDFVGDVQPILKAHCIECHGPDRQSNGFRLDRRRDALLGGTETVLVPGSADGSKVYLRLLGQYAEPMPKEGKLAAAEIATIKAWIDQGAQWPDAVSGDLPVRPPDPAAVQAMNAIRLGQTRTVTAALRGDHTLPDHRGPGGTTPLMSAALYDNAAVVRAMLAAGADPNLANDAGATPLMWGVTDLAVTRALVAGGAAVDARSEDGRTALLIATGVPGSIAVVRPAARPRCEGVDQGGRERRRDPVGRGGAERRRRDDRAAPGSRRPPRPGRPRRRGIGDARRVRAVRGAADPGRRAARRSCPVCWRSPRPRSVPGWPSRCCSPAAPIPRRSMPSPA